MKNVMKAFMLCALSCTFLFTACNNDDNCTAPVVDENIVGTWTLATAPGSEAEFKADGTFVDPDDIIIGFNDLQNKTYEATDSTLTVTASDGSGSNFLSTEYNIVSNECDEITIGFLGIEVVMTRK